MSHAIEVCRGRHYLHTKVVAMKAAIRWQPPKLHDRFSPKSGRNRQNTRLAMRDANVQPAMEALLRLPHSTTDDTLDDHHGHYATDG